jgi:hypothetical protein
VPQLPRKKQTAQRQTYQQGRLVLLSRPRQRPPLCKTTIGCSSTLWQHRSQLELQPATAGRQHRKQCCRACPGCWPPSAPRCTAPTGRLLLKVAQTPCCTASRLPHTTPGFTSAHPPYASMCRLLNGFCIIQSGGESTDSAPAPPKQPLAVGFQFFASLALPLLAALQRPASPADSLAGEHRKAKRRRKSYDLAADGSQHQSGTTSLAWADVARSVPRCATRFGWALMACA